MPTDTTRVYLKLKGLHDREIEPFLQFAAAEFVGAGDLICKIATNSLIQKGLVETLRAPLSPFKKYVFTHEGYRVWREASGVDPILGLGAVLCDPEDEEERDQYLRRMMRLKDTPLEVGEVNVQEAVFSLITEGNRGWKTGSIDSASRFTLAGWDEARRIGNVLNDLGGQEAMLVGHEVVSAILPRGAARELEFAWDGIGSWRS